MSHQYRDANEKWDALISEHLLKQASSTGDDEDKPTALGETELYPDPEGREAPAEGKRLHSDAAREGAKSVRHGTIERALESKLTSAKADKALMAQNFKHVASGDYEAHSPSLQKSAHPTGQTLLEQVRRIAGRD